MWIRPSLGIFAGLASGSKDAEKKDGGLILGDLTLQFGGLFGGTVGFGERWGLYTGINGAVALLPFLGFGFVGIPVGIHFGKKWGLGLIIPVWMTEWYIGLIIGILAFALSVMLGNKNAD